MNADGQWAAEKWAAIDFMPTLSHFPAFEGWWSLEANHYSFEWENRLL
jgi:hypothetical protein